MNTMDRKIAERRHDVTEERARGRLRWLLWLLLAVGVVGAGVWVITSPLLAIRTVTVTGAERTDPGAVARDLGVIPGIPTVSVRGDRVAAELVENPWISQADVIVSWPGSVEIHVVERRPIAAVATPDGEFLVAEDGMLVERIEGGAVPPRIENASAEARGVGDVVTDPQTLAAIDFVAALPPSTRRTTTITVVDDHLETIVSGYSVVLGRPLEMRLKAAVVDALLTESLEPGSRIDVSAPTRPAVAPPQSPLDVETETSQDTQP